MVALDVIRVLQVLRKQTNKVVIFSDRLSWKLENSSVLGKNSQRYCYVCLGYSKTHKCHVFLTVNRQTPLDFSYLDSVLLGRERSWLFRKTCIRCLICARGFSISSKTFNGETLRSMISL